MRKFAYIVFFLSVIFLIPRAVYAQANTPAQSFWQNVINNTKAVIYSIPVLHTALCEDEADPACQINGGQLPVESCPDPAGCNPQPPIQQVPPYNPPDPESLTPSPSQQPQQNQSAGACSNLQGATLGTCQSCTARNVTYLDPNARGAYIVATCTDSTCQTDPICTSGGTQQPNNNQCIACTQAGGRCVAGGIPGSNICIPNSRPSPSVKPAQRVTPSQTRPGQTPQQGIQNPYNPYQQLQPGQQVPGQQGAQPGQPGSPGNGFQYINPGNPQSGLQQYPNQMISPPFYPIGGQNPGSANPAQPPSAPNQVPLPIPSISAAPAAPQQMSNPYSNVPGFVPPDSSVPNPGTIQQPGYPQYTVMPSPFSFLFGGYHQLPFAIPPFIILPIPPYIFF